MDKNISSTLSDTPVSIRTKLAGMWASVVLCYLYGDFFGLFRTSKLDQILQGYGPFGPVTQETLLTVSVIMVVPCLMVFLSLLLKATLCRWLNLAVAAAFIPFVTATIMATSWYFYMFLGVVEILLKAIIVWLAWNWPRHSA